MAEPIWNSSLVPADSAGQKILVRWVRFVLAIDSPRDFLQQVLEDLVSRPVLPTLSIQSAAVLQGAKGQWRQIALAGDDKGSINDLSGDQLGDVLNDGRSARIDGWSVAALGKESDLLLAVCGQGDIDLVQIDSLAAALAGVLQIAERSTAEQNRAQRLSAMLEMTVRWNQTRETGQLLEQMVETSTQLLGAERATIFLRDPNSTMLIGRPALGVDGGELRISQGTGVVGQVVETGEPQRVDHDIDKEQAQIDRSVDQQLGFETRSLVCVPMFDESGATIGAFELLNKIHGNFTQADQIALSELAAHAAVAIVNTKHIENLKSTTRQMADQAAEKVRLIGDSQVIQDLKQTIARVAETELAVLALGENGTGKEVVAQLIHYLSPRRDKVLVAVNCAAISETLLESELFGHEKGAFTDAHETRQGKFELADGGTLFLDEIGDMSLGGQAKLLRVLEEKVIVRVGGSQSIQTDARVIAATNQDLAQLVKEKKFREDLFYRLNVVNLMLPPLRERGEDIAQLAEHFLGDFCAMARRSVPKFTAAARKRLLAHSWPGNVRELRNMMERLAYLFSGEKIDAGDLSFIMTATADESIVPMDLPLTEATRQFQADYIERHIKRSKGNMTEAASRMGLHRSNLYRKMKQLGMDDSGDDGP